MDRARFKARSWQIRRIVEDVCKFVTFIDDVNALSGSPASEVAPTGSRPSPSLCYVHFYEFDGC